MSTNFASFIRARLAPCASARRRAGFAAMSMFMTSSTTPFVTWRAASQPSEPGQEWAGELVFGADSAIQTH